MLSFSLLHGLLGWLGFCLLFRQTEIEKFSTKKTSSQLGGVVGGGSCCCYLRSSDVYTKSRGVLLLFCLLLLRFYVCVCMCVRVRVCVWWYSFVYLRSGYFL